MRTGCTSQDFHLFGQPHLLADSMTESLATASTCVKYLFQWENLPQSHRCALRIDCRRQIPDLPFLLNTTWEWASIESLSSGYKLSVKQAWSWSAAYSGTVYLRGISSSLPLASRWLGAACLCITFSLLWASFTRSRGETDNFVKWPSQPTSCHQHKQIILHKPISSSRSRHCGIVTNTTWTW